MTADGPGRGGIDRRRFLARTAIAGGVAGATWVTPSLLSVDQAFAGSSCFRRDTLDWNSIGVGNPFSSTTFPAVGGYPALTISLTNAAVNTPTAVVGNQRVQLNPNPYGGQANPFYKYFMNNNASGEGYAGTFTFTQPVWNLSFTLFDIDRNVVGPTNGFQDVVYITSGAAFTWTQPTGGSVVGTGTSGTPWTNNGTTAVPDNSDLGNVTVTFAGPVTAFTLTFLSGNRWNRQQSIGIGNLTFCR